MGAIEIHGVAPGKLGGKQDAGQVGPTAAGREVNDDLVSIRDGCAEQPELVG